MPIAKRRALAFTISSLPFQTTLARHIARKNLLSLDNVVWVTSTTPRALSESPQALGALPNRRVIFGYFDSRDWTPAVNDFHRWSRQHILMTLTSLLEVYVEGAATAALLARPTLVDPNLLDVNSVSCLKFPDRNHPTTKAQRKALVASFTKGEWAKRLDRIESVFGPLPQEMRHAAPHLQELQNSRNKIAHRYGVDGDLPTTPWQTTRTIDRASLRTDIRQVYKFIQVADAQVFGPHVGAYEMLNEYASWIRADASRSQQTSGTKNSNFRDYVGAAFGGTPGKAYISGMIDYFDSLT